MRLPPAAFGWALCGALLCACEDEPRDVADAAVDSSAPAQRDATPDADDGGEVEDGGGPADAGGSEDASEPEDAGDAGEVEDGGEPDDAAEPEDAGDSEDAGDTDECVTVAPTSCDDPDIVYADVEPILDEHCLGCHWGTPGGPWPLTNYGHVAAWEVEIRASMLTCSMPPEGSPPMPTEDREKLLMWLRCGAAEE